MSCDQTRQWTKNLVTKICIVKIKEWLVVSEVAKTIWKSFLKLLHIKKPRPSLRNQGIDPTDQYRAGNYRNSDRREIHDP